jgi:hypothetical protein
MPSCAVPDIAVRPGEEDAMAWFHGSPDIRDISAAGGFVQRFETWRVLPDPFDPAEAEADVVTMRKPVFLSSLRAVAATYADDRRAFDYQAAVPFTLEVEVDEESAKILRIDAEGRSFRGISIEAVRWSLDPFWSIDPSLRDDFEARLTRHPVRGRGDGMMSASDLGAIAQGLGFDIVDVADVFDAHDGKGRPSTVRMVFDAGRLEIPAACLARSREAVCRADPPSPLD